MENTGQTAVARIETPNGEINEEGSASIDGVPGTAAHIALTFQDTAGSSCGALLPSGQAKDTINGIDVTMIDNGMPCVVLRAEDIGITGHETPAELEGNTELRQKLEALRLACGPLMNLGDVLEKTGRSERCNRLLDPRKHRIFPRSAGQRHRKISVHRTPQRRNDRGRRA